MPSSFPVHLSDVHLLLDQGFGGASDKSITDRLRGATKRLWTYCGKAAAGLIRDANWRLQVGRARPGRRYT